MLNVGKIEEGYVLDHIKAGKSMSIYHHLGLDQLDCPVAIIKNCRSGKSGKKDILKVECAVGTLDLDVLAFIDHNITVNVIKNGEIIEKKHLSLPASIKNVIRCTNPRCITSAERGLPQIFYLSDADKGIYRCRYCDEKYVENDSQAWSF
ncbi:MAG: aspartate carbamoyltransferase regulatory subunit [Lachnospiraceae bacterium]|nr:aspartate carbamoyltransferase regulatory subunit [Lachnospiraceae bacterium]